MKILEKDLGDFAEAMLATYDLSEMDFNRDVAIESLRKEIKDEFTDLNEEKVKKQRAEFFKVGRPEDYTEHLIDLGNGKLVVCGIRYIGCDLDYPFVKMYANFSISDKAIAKEVYESVKDKFIVFSPKFVSFFSPQKIEADRMGYVYMVAPFEKIKDAAPWENDHLLELKKISSDEYYDWYKQGYEEFHLERPDLKGRVQANSKEVMSDSLKQGLMYYGLIDGERAGFIAGVKSEFLGHAGLYFNEIMVRKKWKGKSIAKVIQQKMIKDAGSFSEFVWGTIDYRNQPSYKTALSNGRRPVRFEIFVKV